jgi:SAM-dependent methyltransferase
MKPTKDNFSTQAATYQKFRPVYPPALYGEILKHVQEKNTAWDCGTGNGQVALVLADHFQKVVATDISERQLKNAPTKNNMEYLVCRAEKTDFPDHHFDLITVAQAIHWFDFDAFYQEVNRVGKPGSLLAVWGYSLLRIGPEIDALLRDFYNNEIGPYWDAERRLVDEQYKTIPFPFGEIKTQQPFAIEVQWGRDQFEGYLKTWSSVQKYLAKYKVNPVDGFMEKVKLLWDGKEVKKVGFPLFVRLGRIG